MTFSVATCTEESSREAEASRWYQWRTWAGGSSGRRVKPEAARMTLHCTRTAAGTWLWSRWGERSSQMMVSSGALTASGTRRLSPVQWNQDGCHRFDVQACEDVPTYDDVMIGSALRSGTIGCENVGGLSQAINRQLWAIGYVARVQSDPVDRSVVVEVSKPR